MKVCLSWIIYRKCVSNKFVDLSIQLFIIIHMHVVFYNAHPTTFHYLSDDGNFIKEKNK